MQRKAIISVIMSVYNTEYKLVKRAIDSVLCQDFKDFELIIIDDGSNNGTQYQILDYAAQHEEKITYLRHKNRGQSASLNRGILNSSGAYVTMLDADDEYKINHLSACLRAMRSADLIASNTEIIADNESDCYVPDRFDPQKLIHVDECIALATLFGKREVFSHFEFEQGYAADARFFERVACRFVVKKLNLRTYIYYRNVPNSICATLKRAQRMDKN